MQYQCPNKLKFSERPIRGKLHMARNYHALYFLIRTASENLTILISIARVHYVWGKNLGRFCRPGLMVSIERVLFHCWYLLSTFVRLAMCK